MKCLRLCLLPALLSLVCLFANGQVNYNNNTLTTQSGFYPSALGSANTANGKFSLVGGTNSTANGECSFGFGNATYATGKNSFAFGYQCEANSDYSLALGYLTKANGQSAIAIGADVQILTVQSIGIGRNLRSTAGGGYIIGMGCGLSQPMVNNIANSLMIGFNSTVPTFFVSNSFGSTLTGKIGIGNIINPTAKLHLLSDAGEAAELKLEHRTTGLRQYSQIHLGTHTIRAGNAENMVFTTSAGKNFAFEEGNVGVGTTDPGSKLHVTGGDVFVEDINSGIIMKSPDGRCWRGTMTNEGVIAFSEIACPVGNGAAGQPKRPATDDVRIYPNPSSCGRFVVERPEAFAHAKVVVFSTDGRLVAEYELPDSMTLHTGILAAGTYVVSVIEQGRLVKSQQVVVE